MQVQLAKITGFGFSTFVASLFLMAGLAMVIVPQDFAILKIGSLWLQSIGTFFDQRRHLPARLVYAWRQTLQTRKTYGVAAGLALRFYRHS